MADGLAQQSVEAGLSAIARDNDRIQAIVLLDPAHARARAAEIDRTAGNLPLHGLSYVAKDLIDVAGLRSCAGSDLFPQTAAVTDAACIAALQSAGAVVLGKSNMHELAVGGAQNPWFGQVINPLSADHGTGGTSSGSAAAVAAGFCDFALGTDSGGSNRSTAAATGLYGFKPTTGILALDGIRPLSPTLDTVGLLAREASVLSSAFAALSGQAPGPGVATFAGRVIGLPTGLFGQIDPAVQDALDRTIAAIKGAGGQIVDFPVEDAAGLAQAGKHILCHEFARLYGPDIATRPDRIGQDVRAFMAIAAGVSTVEYQRALTLVGRHRTVWWSALMKVDAVLAPVAPGLAPRLSDEHTLVGGNWVPYGAAGAQFRMWANTIGIPSVAIPVGRTGGLPASVQLAARPHADSLLIDLSAALGRALADQQADRGK